MDHEADREVLTASYLEVLDIERSLFQAQLDASRTLQEHLSAIVDLYARAVQKLSRT